MDATELSIDTGAQLARQSSSSMSSSPRGNLPSPPSRQQNLQMSQVPKVIITKDNDTIYGMTPFEPQSPTSMPQRAISHGAAFPPDFTPGVQSNSYKDRGGERSQGLVLDTPVTLLQQYQDSMQDPFSSPSSYSNVFGQPYGNDSYNNNSHAAAAAAALMARRRSINFRETIEIIPAHRKADYNRRSDKYATFKILTSDMKSEIREELNSYKMREMTVHIESMNNTAFH
ncbi:hypothetical protein BGZ94_003531 [Podila epigama]|nr:hypothetical protein BGZ94_003531 [Podila epigama]